MDVDFLSIWIRPLTRIATTMRFITKRVVCFQLNSMRFAIYGHLMMNRLFLSLDSGGIIVNMDYIEEIGKTLFKLLFSYKGRVGRLTYWLYPVYSLGTWAFVGAMVELLPSVVDYVLLILFGPLCLGLLYGFIPLHVKRLHDTNRIITDRVETFLCVLPR